MARLFFALWPDLPARQALAAHGERLARLAGGRPVPASRLHLTLVFLGEIEPPRIDSLREAAQEVEANRFGMALDEIGSFRHARVAWAGLRKPSPALLTLQAALAGNLARRGIELEPRPFAPHLTLVRGIGETMAREEIQAVQWTAKTFSLVETRRAGGGYDTVADWSLRESSV
ncbi:MAG: RNA 2',3'-cyclic phosphodiesterase [Betaproteobacteria bacterium]|nr:RNA 2',3'-cyclic phosphodiesterase [Betaproteobacteria bacterium]